MTKKRRINNLVVVSIITSLIVGSLSLFHSSIAYAENESGGTGKIIDAKVMNASYDNKDYEWAVVTIPQEESSKYITARFDARTLGDFEDGLTAAEANRTLGEFLLVDLYYGSRTINASARSEPAAVAMINNMSENEYKVVDIELITDIRFVNKVVFVLTPEMKNELLTNSKYTDLLNKYPTDKDALTQTNKPTSSQFGADLFDMKDKVNGDTVSGLDKLLFDTYNEDGILDNEKLSEKFEGNYVVANIAVSEGLYFEAINYHTSKKILLQFGPNENGGKWIFNNSLINNIPPLTSYINGEKNLMSTLGEYDQILPSALNNIPFCVLTTTKGMGNIYNLTGLTCDIAFQFVLENQTEDPTFTLTYKNSENNNTVTQKCSPGEEIMLPSYNEVSWNDNYIREDMTCVGWKDANGNIYSPGDRIKLPDGDYTLETIWEINKYDFQFNMVLDGMEDKAPEKQIVEHGNSVKAPAEPSHDDYVFKGWYKSPDYDEPWDFENDVAKYHTILYAKWEKKSDGSVPPAKEIDIPESPQPEPKGDGDSSPKATGSRSGSGNSTSNSDSVRLTQSTPDIGPETEDLLITDDLIEDTEPVLAEEADSETDESNETVVVPDESSEEADTSVQYEEWALLNLISVIIGLIAAIVVLVKSRRKNEENSKRLRSRWVLWAALIAILNIGLFIVTENIFTNMAFVDKWTLPTVILLMLQGIAIFLGFKKKNDEQKNTSINQ